MDEQRHALEGEGTPTLRGDPVGPGTGGSPTGAGTGEAPDTAAAGDPDVAALVADLRGDERVLDDDAATAAEQAGTGTDR